jgi:hypothetical protein
MSTSNVCGPEDISTGCSQHEYQRRDFLKMAAAIPMALTAAGVCGTDASAGEAKPGDATKMPLIPLGKHSISRLIVGCHDIDAGSHLGPVHNTCVYERHRSAEELKKYLGHVPVSPGEVYLRDDPPRMFKAIRQTKRTCLAFKILAGGRRYDVEQAFRETFAGIKPTDAVIVGIYDRYSDQAGQNAGLARRFG